MNPLVDPAKHLKFIDDRERSEISKKLIEDFAGEDFWIFGYGSLIWNPDIDYVDSKDAILQRYSRAMCTISTISRGTPEFPGLALGLVPDENSHCFGRMFKLNQARLESDLNHILKREMPYSGYIPELLYVDTPDGQCKSLVFLTDKTASSYVELSDIAISKIIETAEGSRGTNLEYFQNIMQHLTALGIKDQSLERLSVRVFE